MAAPTATAWHHRSKVELYKFFEETCIHGLIYMIKAEHIAITIFWVFVNLTSATLGLYLVGVALDEWVQKPLLWQVQQDRISVVELPFPTVTICPQQTYDRLHVASLLLDTLKFRCSPEAGDCPETKELRSLLADYIPDVRQRVQEIIPNIRGDFNWVQHINRFWKHIDIDPDIEDYIYVWLESLTDLGRSVHPHQNLGNVPEHAEFRFTRELFPYAMKLFTNTYASGIYDNHPWDLYEIVQEANATLEGITSQISEIATLHDGIRDMIGGFSFPEGVECKNDLCGYTEVFLNLCKTLYFMEILGKDHLGSHLRWISQWAAGPKHKPTLLNLTLTQSRHDVLNVIDYYLAEEQQDGAIPLREPHIQQEDLINILVNSLVMAQASRVNNTDIVSSIHKTGALQQESPEPLITSAWSSLHYLDRLATDFSSGINLYLTALDHLDPVVLYQVKYRDLMNTVPTTSTELRESTNMLEMAPFCQFSGADCRGLLHHVFTDQGVCAAFNSLPFWDYFHRDSFTRHGEVLMSKMLWNVNALPQMIGFAEGGTPLKILLDLHGFNIEEKQARPELHVSIGSAVNAFDASRQDVVLWSGVRHHYLITITALSASAEAQGYSVKARDCLFKHEGESRVFKQYSLQLCSNECVMRKVQRNSSCLPWELPIMDLGQKPICSGVQAKVVKQALQSPELEGCQCLDDCERVDYTFQPESVLLNPELECRNEKYFEATQSRDDLLKLAVLESVAEGYLIGDPISMRLCHKKMLEDISILEVSFKDSTAAHMLLVEQNSLFDIAGVIGGTFGLFSGFTFLAAVEVFYWALFILCRVKHRDATGSVSASSNTIIKSVTGFCLATTLHGFKYLVKEKHKALISMWALLITFFIGVLIYLTVTSLQLGYDIDLTIITETKDYQDFRIPFPALTICAVQHYDRWNLPRIMLNTPAYPLTQQQQQHPLSAKRSKVEREFLTELIKHEWLDDDILKKPDDTIKGRVHHKLRAILTSGQEDYLLNTTLDSIIYGEPGWSQGDWFMSIKSSTGVYNLTYGQEDAFQSWTGPLSIEVDFGKLYYIEGFSLQTNPKSHLTIHKLISSIDSQETDQLFTISEQGTEVLLKNPHQMEKLEIQLESKAMTTIISFDVLLSHRLRSCFPEETYVRDLHMCYVQGENKHDHIKYVCDEDYHHAQPYAPQSQAEMDVLYNEFHLPPENHSLLGYTWVDLPGAEIHTLQYEPLKYEPQWAPGHENVNYIPHHESDVSLEGEDCVIINAGERLWDDRHCNSHKYHICEKSSSGQGQCPLGWSSFSQSCYLLHNITMTWHEARAHCQSLDADLAVVETEEENEFLYNETNLYLDHFEDISTAEQKKFFHSINFSLPPEAYEGLFVLKSVELFIGLHDMDREMHFTWIDGSPLTFDHWQAGRPQNYILKYRGISVKNHQWHGQDINRFWRLIYTDLHYLCQRANVLDKLFSKDDPDAWFSPECLEDHYCKALVQSVYQAEVLLQYAHDGLGSLLQHFSETVLANAFHPEQATKENMLIIDHSVELVISVYDLLHELASHLLNEDLGMSLDELPMILSPRHESSRDSFIFSKREQNSRKIAYSFWRHWETHLLQGESYTFFLQDKSRYCFLLNLADLKGSVYDDFMESIKALFNSSATNYFMLRTSIGMDYLSSLDTNNTFGEMMAPHLHTVMTIMRYAEVLANPYQANHSMNAQMNPYAGHYETNAASLKRDMMRLDLLTECEYFQGNCRQDWHHVLTSRGICSAFNAINERVVFKESTHLQYFQAAFDSSPLTSETELYLMNDTDHVKLSMILNVHQTDVFASESGFFLMGLNPGTSAFNMMEYTMAIYPGQRTHIKVLAMVKVIDEDAESYPRADRKCRRAAELPHNAQYYAYTQEACLLQCRLERAYKATKCIPWDYFHLGISDVVDICTRDHILFYRGNFSSHNADSCDCSKGCTHAEYRTKRDSSLLDLDRECSSNHDYITMRNNTDTFAWFYKRSNKWMKDFLGHSLGTSYLDKCKSHLQKDLAFVNIDVSEEGVSVATLIPSSAFLEEITTAGGNLGLFMGCSALSVVELFYWMYKYFTARWLS